MPYFHPLITTDDLAVSLKYKKYSSKWAEFYLESAVKISTDEVLIFFEDAFHLLFTPN